MNPQVERIVQTTLPLMAAVFVVAVQAEEPPAMATRVAQACPNFEQSLANSLDPRVDFDGRRGELRIEFSLKNGQVSDVQVQGGTAQQRRAVRRATYRLDCTATDHAARPYAFMLEFKSSEQAEMAADLTQRLIAQAKGPAR